MLSLLREARSQQLQICDRDDPNIRAGGPLINASAMRQALRALSTIRLEDTLYAEFNHMRPWIERLRGRWLDYTPVELANALGIDVRSDTYANVVADFKYSGFMRESPNKRLSIPILYRASLGIQEGRPGEEEKSAPSNSPKKGGGPEEPGETSSRDSYTAEKISARTGQTVAPLGQGHEDKVDRVSQGIKALRVPYLTADEYHTFFGILADEANRDSRPMGDLVRSVRERCASKGLVLTRSGIDQLMRGYKILRYSTQIGNYRPEDLAAVFFEKVIELLHSSYVDVMPEEREALARRIVGRPL